MLIFGWPMLPPMMGASAFIIVGSLAFRTWELMAVAVIPALLYEISIFFQIFRDNWKIGFSRIHG